MLPDVPYSAAAVYGPFVLAADLGQNDMSTDVTGVNVTIPTKNVSVRETVLVKNVSVREWFADCKKNFVKAEGEVAFFLSGTDADGELLFTPYYRHYNNRYGIYFNYVAAAGLSDGELSALSKKQEEIAEKAGLDAQKQEPPAGKKYRTLWIAAGHLAGALLLAVLLYAFAEPVGRGFSKAKGAIDGFLQKSMPGVAETFGISGDGEGSMPGNNPTETKKVYLEDPQGYAASCNLPEGYQAFVAELSGKEYICVEGKGLRAYYPNEVAEEGAQYIYLETLSGRAVYFWEYSFDVPESLCFVRGVHNSLGTEQYVYTENSSKEGLHLLDVKTLQEHKIPDYGTALALLADVGAYTEEGDRLVIDTVIGDVPYTFSVPRTEGSFNMSDYILHADHELVYTLEQDGIRFDAYVVSAGTYLGKVTGRLTLKGSGYELTSLDFYAYAEDNFGDLAGDSVIRGITREEADKERVLITGDLGERLLIRVREEIKKNDYAKEGFVKDDAGQYTYLENGQKVSLKGVDVSKYQENIDWQKVAADGVEFAIIRLGFRGMGTNGTCELDPYFKQNIEGAKAAGIAVGVYFFTQAKTVEEAKEEARFVIDNLKGYDITWPVVFDTEEITGYAAARANALSIETRTACAKAFLEEIKAAGYTPMLYANTRWSILDLDLAQLGDYDFWYAYYGDDIYYPYQFSMWQYTSSGKVDGIKGNADLNISFKNYDTK